MLCKAWESTKPAENDTDDKIFIVYICVFQCIYVHLAYFLKLPTKQIGLERDLAYIDPPRCTGVVKFSHKTRNKVRQRSGRKVETTTKNQKLCLYKIQQRFLFIFRL